MGLCVCVCEAGEVGSTALSVEGKTSQGKWAQTGGGLVGSLACGRCSVPHLYDDHIHLIIRTETDNMSQSDLLLDVSCHCWRCPATLFCWRSLMECRLCEVRMGFEFVAMYRVATSQAHDDKHQTLEI